MARRAFDVHDLWEPGQSLPARPVLEAIAARCVDVWEAGDELKGVRIGWNPRLRTTAGRAHLTENVVELNPRLLQNHPEELIPTLAHELAHLVVHRRYPDAPPHGRAFRVLLRAVNLSPEARHRMDVGGLRQRRRRYIYLHRCDGCGYRFAARKVRHDLCCRACGPEVPWDVFRVPNTAKGVQMLREAGLVAPADGESARG